MFLAFLCCSEENAENMILCTAGLPRCEFLCDDRATPCVATDMFFRLSAALLPLILTNRFLGASRQLRASSSLKLKAVLSILTCGSRTYSSYLYFLDDTSEGRWMSSRTTTRSVISSTSMTLQRIRTGHVRGEGGRRGPHLHSMFLT